MTYHILNGDALKEQFPESLSGEIIVARECLVDGNVEGESLAAFYKTRAKFLNENYGSCSDKEYQDKVVVEFKKVQTIIAKAEVNLWFEDDLFCQVNVWFVLWLLHTSRKQNSLYLVRPEKHTQYGFGGLSKAELIALYNNRILLKDLPQLAKLWVYYQRNDTQNLRATAKDLEPLYPYILTAVEAHIARSPKEGNWGRPQQALIEIMKTTGTQEFGPVFQEFCKKEAIYGFGDLYVRRLFDEINSNF